jgi:quinol monooxygenase YgiN
MYTRVTSFKIDPARIAELSDKIREMRRKVQALPGLAHAYAAWRPDGHGIIVALYQDKAAAERAVARLQALWGELAGLVAGAPRIDVYDNAEQLTL